MKIYFYRTFNHIGEPVILIRKDGFDFDDLPEHIKKTFCNVSYTEDIVSITDFSSRWWLCKAGAINLEEKGYDCFTIARHPLI